MIQAMYTAFYQGSEGDEDTWHDKAYDLTVKRDEGQKSDVLQALPLATRGE
jgi:hypothetical protein